MRPLATVKVASYADTSKPVTDMEAGFTDQVGSCRRLSPVTDDILQAPPGNSVGTIYRKTSTHAVEGEFPVDTYTPASCFENNWGTSKYEHFTICRSKGVKSRNMCKSEDILMNLLPV